MNVRKLVMFLHTPSHETIPQLVDSRIRIIKATINCHFSIPTFLLRLPVLPPVLPENSSALRAAVWAGASSVTEWRTAARGRTSSTASVSRTR